MDRALWKAKHYKTGKWIIGHYYTFTGPNRDWIGRATGPGDTEHRIKEVNKIVSIVIDSETLCQCTGLKDSKDVLIFEGDRCIATGEDYNGNSIDTSGVVVHNIIQLGWYIAVNNSDVEECLAYLVATDDEFEVIGNIHDKEKV